MTDQQLLDRYFLARILQWRDELDKLDKNTINEIVQTLQSLKRDITKRLNDEAQGIAEITDWTRERLKQVNKWLDEVLASTNKAVTDKIATTSAMAAAASVNTYNSILSLNGMAKAVITVGFTKAQLRSWFRDTPLGGGTLQSWVNRAFTDGVKKSILNSLRKSGIEGKGIAAAVKRLMRLAIDEGFSLTQREAIMLTRTYIQTANVKAMESVCEANKDIIIGMKRVETLDNRTCLMCALADGSVYKMNEKRPQLPAHPNCRGIWRPLTKASYLDIDKGELRKVTRPWAIRKPGSIGTGGKKIEKVGTTQENFEGWYNSLSKEDKAKTGISKTRRKLLESGQVKWSDLWDRETGHIRSLKKLGYNLKGNRLEYTPDELYRVSHTDLKKFINKPSGSRFPIGKLSKQDASQIGAANTVAMLSTETMNKQKSHHPELTVDDYRKIQDAIDRGEKIQDGERNLIYVVDESEHLTVVVKATFTGDELFVTSVRRMSRYKSERQETIEKLRNKRNK